MHQYELAVSCGQALGYPDALNVLSTHILLCLRHTNPAGTSTVLQRMNGCLSEADRASQFAYRNAASGNGEVSFASTACFASRRTLSLDERLP